MYGVRQPRYYPTMIRFFANRPGRSAGPLSSCKGGFLDLGKAFYVPRLRLCHLTRQPKGLTAVVAFTCSISPSVLDEPRAAEERRWPSAQLPKSHLHIAYLGALSTPYVEPMSLTQHLPEQHTILILRPPIPSRPSARSRPTTLCVQDRRAGCRPRRPLVFDL